jgi:hypothetical protein
MAEAVVRAHKEVTIAPEGFLPDCPQEGDVYDTVLHAVGSSLTLTGAFAIGWALHRTLWVGDLPLTSPAAVGAVAVGVALVGAGRAVERRYEDRIRTRGGSADENEGGREDEDGPDPDGAEQEYDESFSPVDEATLEASDADRDGARD